MRLKSSFVLPKNTKNSFVQYFRLLSRILQDARNDVSIEVA